MQILKIIGFISVYVIGYVGGDITGHLTKKKSCDELERDVRPYQTCMTNAGRLRCRIQVTELMKYHDLQDQIEARCNEISEHLQRD